jgi:glycerol-3-phosphate dehydrogenase
MASTAKMCSERAKADLKSFIAERWKGMSAVAWGDTLREGEMLSWLYDGVCNLSNKNQQE